MKVLLFNTKKQFKKGFTLVELIIAMAMLAILTVGLASAMAYGTNQYVRTRTQTQATALANDLVLGIQEEVGMSYKAMIEYNEKSALNATEQFSNSGIYQDYTKRIYLDLSTYRIVGETKNGAQTDNLKSKYYSDLKVKNLVFETKHNTAYDNDGVEGSGKFNGIVDNILTVSFQIYNDAEVCVYEVKNYSIVLDNMVTRIFSKQYTEPNLDDLKIVRTPIDGYDIDLIDFDVKENLNTDNILDCKYYNMLYFTD